MTMNQSQQNTILGIALFVGSAMLAIFCTALLDSKAGEIAGAVGSVVGGIIGALGAALAVYLTLKGQRDDETDKVCTAIITEISQLAKFPCEQLATCQAIHEGLFHFPREKLSLIMQTPAPGPEATLVAAMLVEIVKMLDEQLEKSSHVFPTIQAYQQATSI
jgi:hypothetical protein